jgi:sugar phosphate isomerase/epimerase
MTQGGGRREAGKASRREFVTMLGAGTIALSHPSLLPPLPSRLDAIGLQLYTVRGLMQQDFAGTLEAVARIGYREVEFAGYFDRSPEQVRRVLEHNGLVAPAAHVPFEALESDWDATLHIASLIGHQYLVCAWIPEERRRTLADWRGIAQIVNRAGAAARAAGVQLAYHNHSYEFVPLGGQIPYDVFTAATDPDLVRLELDLFWITFGGGDPLVYFARYPGRFPLVHVKDMMPKPSPDVAPERVMADVGKGRIDWRRIFAHAGQAGIRHYFVEHDDPPDPLASIRASFEYLRALEF